MKIVIVGDGKVGFALTAQLAQEGHDIVVIDNNKKVLQESAEQLDVMVVHGNGAGVKAQKQAGVEDADLLIAATSADEINLLCCIVARKLGSAHTIARVRNPEYVEQIYFLKDELGLSMTINPERAAAREISRLLQFPSFLKRDSFAKGRAEIVEMVIKEGSVLEDKLLSELYQIAKVQVLVCAVKRGGRAYIPDGSFRLMRGDRIFVTAPTHNLARLIKHLGLQTQKIREVILVGGSSIAYYLAMDLFLNGIRVKIIESQADRCLELAELLPKAMIIHGDGANQSVLLAEGIEKTDAVVTLTNLDEENFLVSMYANYLKVPKVITKINRTEFNDIFQDKGIDCVVSPKLLTANDIVRYVRAMQNKTGDSMITLHRIADDMAEAMEFPVTEETRHLGETLIRIRLRPNILIACINRRGKIIIPKGDDTIELNDTVIVVTTAEQRINELNDIFEDPA
ncbi:MAG TPA: Trk system potassium transporter TrkA [Candidatus Fimivivens faecavium]|nr:Trk system potassium transporter TrkA [Candidatus Fimivivens faecavium]